MSVSSAPFTCPERVLIQAQGWDLEAGINLGLRDAFWSADKRGEPHGQDVGTGAAAAVSPVEAASVIRCLKSAAWAGARWLSRFHLPRYFPSNAVRAEQLPLGPTEVKPF